MAAEGRRRVTFDATRSNARAILVERPSMISLLAAARAIRRSDVLYLGRDLSLSKPPASIRRAAAFARWLNPAVAVETLPVDAISPHLWTANAAAPARAAGLKERIERTRTFRTMQRIIRDPELVKYYQAAIARRLPSGDVLAGVAADLAATHRSLHVVARWDSGMAQGRRPTTAQRVERLLDSWHARLRAAIMPAAFAGIRLWRSGFCLRRAERETVDAALPVVWGFQDQDASADGPRRPHDDAYLYGRHFKAGQVVHVFGDWRFPDEEKARYTAVMDRRGLQWLDRDRAPVGWSELRRAARVQLRALSLLVPAPSRDPLDTLVLGESPKALFTYLRKHAELDAAPVTVQVLKDDYNPGHIVATIACHERGVRTFGIQHTALAYGSPQLAFVHCDKYAVYGQFYADGFAGHWPASMIEPTGRESIDWTVDALASRDPIRDKWRLHYPEHRGPIALVLFPGTREICLPRQWRAMFEALDGLRTSRLDCTIVLRFRNAASLDAPVVRPFVALPELDSRFVIELTRFTTYELIALSSLVITPEASFTINEALPAGVPVFTFEYVGTASHYFRDYGRDFVLRTAADVRRVFDHLPVGFDGFDCDWRRLRQDANFYEDGANHARLQAAVRRLCHGIPAATPVHV